nr:hypothetical protein [Stackebrandtia nassauensis]
MPSRMRSSPKPSALSRPSGQVPSIMAARSAGNRSGLSPIAVPSRPRNSASVIVGATDRVCCASDRRCPETSSMASRRSAPESPESASVATPASIQPSSDGPMGRSPMVAPRTHGWAANRSHSSLPQRSSRARQSPVASSPPGGGPIA